MERSRRIILKLLNRNENTSDSLPTQPPKDRNSRYSKPEGKEKIRRKKKNRKSRRRRKSSERSSLSTAKRQLDSKIIGEVIIIHGIRYRRRRKLGSGGSGSVYEIQREDNGTCYALKEAVLRQNGNVYRGEAERLQTLRNAPHIIALIAYDFTANEQMLRMVLELGETDLERELKMQKGKFDEDTIRTFSLEIAKGIKEMHDHSIIHLDIKLANVMFVNGALKIVDLGLSATIPHGVDYVIRDFMFGSNRPPEQIVPRSDGTYKLTKKVDIWGLGTVVYQMRYGRKPFTDCPENTMIAVLNPNVRLQHDIGADSAMTEFLEMCTIRDVGKRASIEQLLEHRYLAEAFPLAMGDDFTATSPSNQKSESSIRVKTLGDTQSKLA